MKTIFLTIFLLLSTSILAKESVINSVETLKLDPGMYETYGTLPVNFKLEVLKDGNLIVNDIAEVVFEITTYMHKTDVFKVTSNDTTSDGLLVMFGDQFDDMVKKYQDKKGMLMDCPETNNVLFVTNDNEVSCLVKK